MTPNYPACIAFLKKFHPGRSWVLTAISPTDEKPKTITETFSEASEVDCLVWLSTMGAHRNLYFSVNECKGHLSSKAGRDDILNLHYLHIDIDPRTGEDIPTEQARILKLLTEYKTPPSIITFSGGGYQGFWALDNPVKVNGDLDVAEDVKLYNLQLELDLGADNVHNIDRIMRLPGSINRPDAKKIAKGRTEALAGVVSWSDVRYSLGVFSKARHVAESDDATADDFGGYGKKVSYSPPANVNHLASIEDLPSTVSNRTKVIIVQGFDPDERDKYGASRNEWLFLVVTNLVKAGVDDDTIFAVITDPKFGISASVLDDERGVVKYAKRQIKRARDEVQTPRLKTLNDRFFVVESMAGKCRVVEEQDDEILKRKVIVTQEFGDFKNRFMNFKIPATDKLDKNGNAIEIPVGLWWLSHPCRRQYEKIVFAPGRHATNSYNLWRGFGCAAKEGDCGLFLDHLKDVICGGNEEYYTYLISWMANAVQFPDRPGFSAIVLKGDQGTGKSLVAKTLGSLFGRHFMQVTDPKHLVGSFNYHLRDCVLLFGDEAFFAGDKKHESILKMIITEERITIESKGVNAEQCPNFIHLLMASNDHWVVPAGVGDRRFFVLHVKAKHKDEAAYFEPMLKQIEGGGREALLFYLMNYDLSNFDVRTIPKTDELQEQKMFSLGVEETWWHEKLREGRLLPQQGNWIKEVAFGDLFYDYITHCRSANSYRRASKRSLQTVLNRYLAPLKVEHYNASIPILVKQVDGTERMVENPPFLRFPSLAECRGTWDKHFGGASSWAATEQADLYAEVKSA